jgi:hypothetical protein
MYLLRTIARALHIDYRAPYDAHKYATTFGKHEGPTASSSLATTSTPVATKPWERPRSILYGAPQRRASGEQASVVAHSAPEAVAPAPTAPRTYSPGTWLVTSEHGAVSGAQRQLVHDRPDTMETDPVYAMSLQAHGAPYATMVHPPESNADHMETSGVMMNPYTAETYQLFEEALPPPNRTRGGTNAADRSAMRLRLDAASGGAAAVTRRAKKEVVQEWNEEDAGVPTAVMQAQIERTTLQRRETQNKQALFGNFNDDCPGSPQMSRQPLPPILVEPPLIATNALDKEVFQVQNRDALNYGQGRPFKPGMRLRHETLPRADDQMQGPGLAQESAVGPYNTMSTAYGDTSGPSTGFSALEGLSQPLEPSTAAFGSGTMTTGHQGPHRRSIEFQNRTAELDPFAGPSRSNPHISQQTALAPSNSPWAFSMAHPALPGGDQTTPAATSQATSIHLKEAIAYGDVSFAPISTAEKAVRVVAQTWTTSAKQTLVADAQPAPVKHPHAAPARIHEADPSRHQQLQPLSAAPFTATLAPDMTIGLQSLLALTEPPSQKTFVNWSAPSGSLGLTGTGMYEALEATRASTHTDKDSVYTTVHVNGVAQSQLQPSAPTQQNTIWQSQTSKWGSDTPLKPRVVSLLPSSSLASTGLDRQTASAVHKGTTAQLDIGGAHLYEHTSAVAQTHRGGVETTLVSNNRSKQSTPHHTLHMSTGGADPGGPTRAGDHNVGMGKLDIPTDVAYGAGLPTLQTQAGGDTQTLRSALDTVGKPTIQSDSGEAPMRVHMPSRSSPPSLHPTSMLDALAHQSLDARITATTSVLPTDGGAVLGGTAQTVRPETQAPLSSMPLGPTLAGNQGNQESRVRDALVSLPGSKELTPSTGVSRVETLGGAMGEQRTQAQDTSKGDDDARDEKPSTHGTFTLSTFQTGPRATEIRLDTHQTLSTHLGTVGTRDVTDERTMAKTTQHHLRAKSTPLVVEGLHQAPSLQYPMLPPVTVKDTTKLLEKQRGRSPAPLPLTAGSTSLTSQPHVPRLHGLQEQSQAISADLTTLQRLVPEPPSFSQNAQTLLQQAPISSKKHKLRSRSPLTAQANRAMTRHMSVGEGRRLHERSESRTTEV